MRLSQNSTAGLEKSRIGGVSGGFRRGLRDEAATYRRMLSVIFCFASTVGRAEKRYGSTTTSSPAPPALYVIFTHFPQSPGAVGDALLPSSYVATKWQGSFSVTPQVALSSPLKASSWQWSSSSQSA
eukprot:Polyplicarium_translucidae@DN3308_c2_g1_i15.p1